MRQQLLTSFFINNYVHVQLRAHIKVCLMVYNCYHIAGYIWYSAFNLEEPLFIPRVVCVVSPHNFLHSPFYCINADCNYEDEKMQDTRCSTALSH